MLPASDDRAPAPLTAEQETAASELDTIYSNPRHPYHDPGHLDHARATERVLALHRTRLGPEQNRVVAAFHEPGDVGVLPAVPASAPLVTWADFEDVAPPEMPAADVKRVQSVAEPMGVGVHDAVVLLALTQGAPPAAEAMPDLEEAWGPAWQEKAARVGAVMRRIKTVDADLYERLKPHVQGNLAVAEHVLGVAERLRVR